MPGHTDPTLPTFGGGTYGWNGTQWRKLALLFGYSERWEEDLGGTVPADGDWIKYSVVVPSGYVYTLQLVVILNNSGAGGATSIALYGTGGPYFLAYAASSAQDTPLLFTGMVTLKEDDKVRVRMNDVTKSDVIIACAWGYKMAIAE